MIKNLKKILVGGFLLSLVSSCKDTTEENYPNWDYIKSQFSTCIGIGDSVTEGHIYDYPATPAGGIIDHDYSYPAFLARLTGWEVENAGVSGIKASEWWKNHFGNYDYSNYEIAIIEFGYNGPLTDSLETDVNPYSDYNDYSDTETGNYCRIIQGIKNQNPNIIIILSISSQMKENSGEAWSQCRTAIFNIAKKYSLPVIDLADSSYIDLNDAMYHGKTNAESGLNMIHFNVSGYNAKAEFIRHALETILKDAVDKR